MTAIGGALLGGAYVVTRANMTMGARRARREWPLLAAELGLHSHASPPRVSGWLGDDYVTVRIERGYGALRTQFDCFLWPPLDLGMRVIAGGGAPPFTLVALEPQRGRQLVAAELVTAIKALPQVVITDRHVSWLGKGVLGCAEARAKLEQLVGIARIVNRRRGVVSLPRELAPLHAHWTRLATGRGLTVSLTPLSLSGRARGIDTLAFVERDSLGGHTLVVVGKFRRPLGIGYHALSRVVHAEVPWGMTELTTGDAGFDRVFRVTAADAEWVKLALNPAARARLLELAREIHDILVDDYGVRLSVTLQPDAPVAELLERAGAAAELVDFVSPRTREVYR